ncbi:unnamed protein product [Polarella glacialis]|uniref:Uncharacterized protein n=1 Tax=Polarella glacialis TaxID=89957 RepID=A0A813HBD5_POLGL|nr:unnamed protein product [Polarella glacialis]
MYGWLNSSATGSFAYCNNNNYDFVWSPEWGYGPYACAFQPFEELWTKMTEGLFFTTSMLSTKSKCFDVSGGVHTSDACDTEFAAANLSCTAGSYYRVGTCCCDEAAYTFPVAAEHMSMEFEHGFSSTYAQHIPSGKAYLPRTIFRLKSCIETKLGSCDILEVPQGNLVTLPLQALFKLLAIDLDEDSCTQNGGRATDLVDGKCQKARVGGMKIELGISYYNFDQNAALKDDDPLCIIDLDPTLTWTDIGSVIIIDSEPLWAEGTGLKNAMQSVSQERQGVKITFSDKGGKIGRFNYVYLLNVLVNAVVLMGVADVVASLIAKFGLGKKSQMYNAAINERLSFSRELARFSAQALVAKNCFNSIDTDGDGTLESPINSVITRDVEHNGKHNETPVPSKTSSGTHRCDWTL